MPFISSELARLVSGMRHASFSSVSVLPFVEISEKEADGVIGDLSGSFRVDRFPIL